MSVRSQWRDRAGLTPDFPSPPTVTAVYSAAPRWNPGERNGWWGPVAPGPQRERRLTLQRCLDEAVRDCPLSYVNLPLTLSQRFLSEQFDLT